MDQHPYAKLILTSYIFAFETKLPSINLEFVSIQDKLDSSTASGKAMFGMLSVLAEFERDIIRERTMAGLKAARARGRKGGRPKVNQQRLNQAIAMYHSERMTVKEIQEATGVSAATIYRELKKEQNQ